MRFDSAGGFPRPILFLCQVFPPDPQSTSQLFGSLVGALGKKGVGVEVWSGMPAIFATPRRSEGNGWRVLRLGLPNRKHLGLSYRVIAYGSYLFAVGLRLIFLSRHENVVATTNPPFLPIWVWFISAFRGWRYRLVILDQYPEGLEQIGWLSTHRVISRIWRFFNGKAYRAALQISVLGRDMARLIQRNYGVAAKTLDWVPHWSATEPPVAKPAKQSRILHRLGLTDKWVVQYSGNMGLWHDLENVVRAAHLLQKEPDLRFLLAGGGLRRTAAEKLARNLDLSNVIWIDPVPLEELDDLLAGCHAALISQNEGLVGVAVPCKLYGILASGRPILAAVPRACEAARVVLEEQCGEVLPPHDPHALADSIRRWLANPKEVQSMGHRARQAYERHYTLDCAVERFRKVWQI